ncbi:unnamed protein product [Acanthoscelides obtectus]|uniref:Uncharacterized protein n=1 Tax=Acanthoscelides obtectus TaxID=200917 RepID=A0A9P0K7D1_ACAOB|nr:unnamed protein product [Acanthoscelides obtectus]CAK1653398.1 SCAN domain-containing protein 3 [Acanthoscelides obtectus]
MHAVNSCNAMVNINYGQKKFFTLSLVTSGARPDKNKDDTLDAGLRLHIFTLEPLKGSGRLDLSTVRVAMGAEFTMTGELAAGSAKLSSTGSALRFSRITISLFATTLWILRGSSLDVTESDGCLKRPTLDRMFASTSQRNDDGLRASYYISLLIAKSGKPHTIGEKLILPAVEEVLKTVLHKPASDIIKRIPLSNNTVERRIDEMSSDIESFLCNYLQTTHFSIQLDESTVRFIMNQEIYEELLFARTLISDTKDFESRFEDILTMVIPPWIINPYGDIEETNVIIQEELTELSTNEELKVQFKNGYQQFWLQNNIPVASLALHRVCVNLTHVPPFIGFPNVFDVEMPDVLLTVRHTDPAVLSDYVIVDSQDCLGVHFQPSHLEVRRNTRNYSIMALTRKDKIIALLPPASSDLSDTSEDE